MSAILSLENIYAGYPGNDKVIKGISFAVEKGSFIGIIGPNGCGKSTLVRLIGRVIEPSAGTIRLLDRDVTAFGSKEFSRMVGIVSQEPADFPFTVNEMVLMGRIPYLKRLEFEKEWDFSVVDDALRLTDSFHLKDKFLNELSSGERQRVMTAMALAQEPQVLILDEPTSHLDIGHGMQILDLLKKLNREKGITIIVVLHDLNLTGEYCDRIILIDNGRIFKDGGAFDVLTYENIEAVYKTVVVVKENPVTKKPYLFPIPGDLCKRG